MGSRGPQKKTKIVATVHGTFTQNMPQQQTERQKEKKGMGERWGTEYNSSFGCSNCNTIFRDSQSRSSTSNMFFLTTSRYCSGCNHSCCFYYSPNRGHGTFVGHTVLVIFCIHINKRDYKVMSGCPTPNERIYFNILLTSKKWGRVKYKNT